MTIACLSRNSQTGSVFFCRVLFNLLDSPPGDGIAHNQIHQMHYKNGREAKAGDKIVNLPTGLSGVLHSPNAKSETCNGRIAAISQNDPYVTLGECLHLDDIAASAIVDSTQPTKESA